MRALIVILLLPIVAHAQPGVPTVAVEFESVEAAEAAGEWACVKGLYDGLPFSTLEQAIVFSLGRLMHEAMQTGWDEPKYESAGYVIELDGKYIASQPVTQYDGNSVRQECMIFLPGSELAALFHTHTAEPNISRSDVAHADSWDVPTYVGTLRDGIVRKYDPETRRSTEVGTIDATELDAMRFSRTGRVSE